MCRKIVTAVCVLVTFLLQSTVFPALPFFNVTPNLLLILTVSLGFVHGRRTGLWVGFLCGLLIDLFYSNLFGFYSLTYMYIGYLNGLLYQVFFDEDIKVPMILTAVSDFGYNLVFYVIQFAFRMRFDFSAYLVHTILPEMVFTVLLSIPLYRIFFLINRKLVRYELEGQQSPWLKR
ncbi:MAG TPA: rod shape-determining protein MreD [Candidatus Scatomonas merdigallinarum]|nr:rod shape-determining protein MreD [Candidatus Scatomonas merdigallinarum]